jgi:hypothetical protein
VIKLVDQKDLTCEQKRKALNYLMYLKQRGAGKLRPGAVQMEGNNEIIKARKRPVP